MSRIFAPEFRGNIDSYLVLPFLRVGLITLILLSAIVIAFQPQPSRAAEMPLPFSRIPSSDCAALFALRDLDGREHSLAARKGRPVAVHFFASWCEPCEAEFGTLQHFYEAHGNKIDILAVDVGEVRARVQSFLTKKPVTFPVLLDVDRTVTKAWAVDGLPATFVLDDTLRPVLRVTGDLDWTRVDVAAEIESTLKNNSVSRNADCTKEHSQ